MLCMMFGQLCNRESLRDLVLTINAHPSKRYHLGFGKGVSKSNLGVANEQRPFEIYQEFAYHLINEARKVCVNEDVEFSFTNTVYAFDSTIIDLCLSAFGWATFRYSRGAVKLHTQYDVRTSIPVFVMITAGSVNDMNAMDAIKYETGSFYIFDRGYLDFKRLYCIDQLKAFFVIRARNNIKFKRQYSSHVNKETGVLFDQTGSFVTFYSMKGYPNKIRRIKFYDKEQDRYFVFLTNNFELEAIDIASIYKHRWKIELFFVL